ncbi:MAG: enoyl-CoA hydratase [Nevskiaceae bacterium]|nr:MAG: enoyl-CoA hydratase [Nevskiaceae bacterium]
MSQVLIEKDGGVMTLRFHRPDKKNALTAVMYQAAADALTQAAADPTVRVALITGTKDCFSSGNDLQDFLQNPPVAPDAPVAQFMRAVATFPKPLVAAVNGFAIGVGTTLLLHCDLVYAGQGARFQLPFVNIGICPELASSYLMPRSMGYARAAELVLLGEPFTAEKALAYGIVNEVLPDAECEARARNRAERLAAQPPEAMRTAKMLLRRWDQQTVLDAIAYEASYFMPMLGKPEAREAMTAFMEKRKPDFSRFS